MQSTDVQQTLLKNCAELLNDTSIPQCHGLARKALTKFLCLRLRVYGKQISTSAAEEFQHGSKSAKSRTVIKLC